jgi:class 3 adenylate cyclase
MAIDSVTGQRHGAEGERKRVTALFADLKGSLELLADRDPEEARLLPEPVLERMMEAVHGYEGTANQVMGDSIMALFGAPLADEDHTVRACYAALRMQEAVARYAEKLRARQGVDVQIRVGLNCGEAPRRGLPWSTCSRRTSRSPTATTPAPSEPRSLASSAPSTRR